MEISPLDIVKLTFYALIFGVICGVLNDVNRFVRAFFGEMNEKHRTSFYSKKIPVLKRTISPIRVKSKCGKIVLMFMIAAQDIFLFFFAGAGCVSTTTGT